VRDITTSGEAPYLRLRATWRTRPACPEGRTAGPIHATALDESRAAHKETSPQAAHGTKTNSAAAPRFAVAAARSKKRSFFVDKHGLLNWLKPATSILFRVFQVGVRPPSSVDRRSEPQCNAGVNLNLPPAKVSEESGIKAESSSSHKYETFKPRFSLSVDRREVVFHRAVFEHLGFPPAKKIWWAISHGGCFP
jgi:hypothetical protein